MDLKLRTVVLLVTAVVFFMVVSIASFIQRTASDIEEALFFDIEVRVLDVATVQHSFYINPNQIKQFILNNQTQHRVLLYAGSHNPINWYFNRAQFIPNDFNVNIVYFRYFPSRIHVIYGVSRTEEFSMITFLEGGPPENNVPGVPYVGREIMPPFGSRPGEPLGYANNARFNYDRFVEVTSYVAGGFYNFIHAFVINAQLDEFTPEPMDIQYRVQRWLNPDGSLVLTVRPTHMTFNRPVWLDHQRVTDMVQRW